MRRPYHLPLEELVKLMGMDDSQWASAGCLSDLLHTLHEQRDEDVGNKRGGYVYAAIYMYRWTFGPKEESYYDSKRKSLWYLGRKAPTEAEDPTLDVQHTFHITQKSHHLSVYRNIKGLPPKKVFRFDMLRPDHRVAFLNVRHHAAEKYPPVDKSVPPKHRDLLRVQHSPKGNRSRRRTLLWRSSALARKPQTIEDEHTINDR